MRAGSRAFRWLLRLLPPEFRRRHGEAVERALEEALCDAPSRRARARVLLRGSLDLLEGALALRSGARVPLSDAYRPEDRLRPEMLVKEFRRAGRHLATHPAFALTAGVTLGLGIAAVTLVFSAVHGVLLRPLPYEAADRIGILWHDLGDGAQSLPALNPLDWRDYRERARTFEDMTLATGRESILTGGNAEPELVQRGFVAAGFFQFLGVKPLVGRSFREAEDAPGGPPVALLSHRIWQRRFGGDEAVVGRTVEVDGLPHEVVGVLPADFRLLLPPEAFRLRDADLYTPIRLDWGALPPRNYTGFTGFVRLRPEATWAQAQEELARMAADLRREHPAHAAANLRARIVPLHRDVVKEARRALLVLMGAVGLVLLVACANVAHLFLARSRSRDRELAMMAALGASRVRLAWSVAAETALVTAGGAALGVAGAWGGLRLLAASAAAHVPRLDGIALEVTSLAFATLVSVLTALAFGLLPALHASRTDVAGALKEGGRVAAGRRQRRARSLLIAGEVALSVMLLVGAGLLLRSFVALQDSRPGFDAAGVLTFRIALPPNPEYGPPDRRIAFFDQLRTRLAALPGVVSVSGISQLPLTGSGPLQPFAYDEETARNWESVTADQRVVFPGFFRTIGATLLAGREFSEADVRGGSPLIVIDETLAARAWPGQDPVGKLLQVEPSDDDDRFAEVVGVVRHLRLYDLARPHLPQIYFPYDQAPWPGMVLTVRTAGEPAALAPAIRGQVHELDAGLPVNDLHTMSELVAGSLGERRFTLGLLAAFAALALAMSGVGVYGVIAYTVSLRTREIGVRMALGETQHQVLRRTVWQGMRVVCAAILIGAGGALLLSRSLAAMLYGVPASDPVTFAIVAVLVGSVGLAACWLPARRATRIQPASALRRD